MKTGIIIIAAMVGGLIWLGPSGKPPSATAEGTDKPAAPSAEKPPHYTTPTGPTTVKQPGTVGCLDFKDAVDVAASEFGLKADIKGLIKANRCVEMPVGTSVEVVERLPQPNGQETNSVCVKPIGHKGPACFWLLIQQLDVTADSAPSTTAPPSGNPLRDAPHESLLDTKPKPAGTLEIEFQRWSLATSGVLQALVAMKNTTGADYATVTWSCEFREGGYKTGEGVAVFHAVPKNSIALDTLSFYNNSRTADVTIKCELAGTEKRSRENERLYRYGPQRRNVPANSTDFWRGRPDGVAKGEE
jgi:hypothetical protein